MKLYSIFPYVFQTIMRPIVWIFLTIFCQLEVDGLENIENVNSNFILASNHIHELDGFLLPAAVPLTSYFHPIFPVSREKEFYKTKGWRGKLYGGKFFKFMGAYPAKSGLQDYKASLRNQLSILGSGHSILIFPEGKVSSSGFKGGVGFLALETNKPVIPVRIKGIRNINLINILSMNVKMHVSFLRPVQNNGVQGHKSPSPKECKTLANELENIVYDSESSVV